MYTFVLRLLSVAWLLLSVPLAHSQNIDTNPGFDTGIDGWITSGTVEWAADVGYRGPSIHLDTQTSASVATQCIWAEGGQSFVATARVYAHCPGARFYVFWSSNTSCTDTGAFPDYFAVSSQVDQWEPLAVTAPAQDGAFVIQLMLYNDSGCSDGVYFDDVLLQFDDIYNDGFDLRGVD
jgi:hypothetical protein